MASFLSLNCFSFFLHSIFTSQGLKTSLYNSTAPAGSFRPTYRWDISLAASTKSLSCNDEASPRTIEEIIPAEKIFRSSKTSMCVPLDFSRNSSRWSISLLIFSSDRTLPKPKFLRAPTANFLQGKSLQHFG